jgi:glycerophosphoryl diester phosphodiesterase
VEYFSPAPPRILAHRGLAIHAPENTLLAFIRALAIGVTYIETDVHASCDGVAVISHDPDLSRLVGRNVRVNQLTFAELKRIDLGDGQNYTSLADALDAFPDALFNIDVKSDDAVAPTIAAIREAAATSRVLVTSFDAKRRRATVKGLPGVVTSASAREFAVALVGVKLGLSPLVRRALRGIDAVQVPERFGIVRVITPRTVKALHAAGVEVHVWTVNDGPAMRRLLELGVDGLVTDRSDLALRVVASLS